MRNRLMICRCFFLAVAGILFAHSASAGDSTTAFVHVNVVPMDREEVLHDQNVIISNGRIQAMGPADATPVPKDARVISGTGQYLMPGLADMHVHLYFPEELSLYVANGVTTVFNLNGAPAHLNWRAETASGQMLGPTIYSVGPTFDHARSPEDAVKAVDQISADGYDGVKIYNQVSRAEYPALIAEAKSKNLLIVGHIAREPGFAMTLQAGQSIAHAEEYLYTFFNDDPDPKHDLTHSLDAAKIPQAVAMTRQSGVSVIATLVAYHNIIRQLTDLPAYLKNPDLQYLAPSMFEALRPGENGYQKRISKDQIPSMTPDYEFQKKLIKALHDGGVPVLAGTDAAWLGVPGFSLIEEVENFQDIGFTPYAALRTATIDCATFLRHSDDFGSVATGKRADLILLSKNPLDDVRNLHQLSGVMVRGRWISASETRALLQTVPPTYRVANTHLLTQIRIDPSSVDQYLAHNDPFGEQAAALLDLLASQAGSDKFVDLLLRVQKSDPKSPLVAESSINALGYKLLGHKKTDDAVRVFKLNTELYPRSGNTFDSLAETYLGLGNKNLAKQNYQKALEVQPAYPNAKEAQKILDTQLK
jgi:tetratricopeptide (TPR) repeat protein